MPRQDDVEFVGERVIERQVVRGADIVMQHEHRAATAGAPEMELYLAQLDVLFAPSRHRTHPIS
jgi:hypothetical protein